MDIQVASNFERYLYYRAGGDPTAVRALMDRFRSDGRLSVKPLSDGRMDDVIVAGSANTAETMETIRAFMPTTGTCWIRIPRSECTWRGSIRRKASMTQGAILSL